ncbi:MAG: PIN domain-containing protein [Oscillospiraceae bacterium]
MDVIIDTNIIVSDFYMKNANFILLFDFSKKVPFDVYIPEIVYDEIFSKYREMLSDKLISYQKSIVQFKTLLASSDYDFLSFDLEMECENYKDFVDEKITKGKLKLLPYPKTSHKDIVAHELSRKKPFKSNGSGYRDKLIIDTIFEKYKIPQESVIFISNNLNDFGVEPDFDKDLFYGKKVSNQFKFRIINKLANFIDQYIQPMKQVNNEFETILQLSDFTGTNISDWLLLNMKDIIYDNGLGYAIMGLEEGYGTVMLHKIDFIKNIAVSDFTKTDDNLAVGKIIIDADLVMYISGDQDDFLRSESWRDFFEYDASERYVDISTWQSVSTRITISIIIDITKNEIISYEPISVYGESGKISFEW